MTIGSAPDAMSIDNAITDNAGAGADGTALKETDLSANDAHSKVSSEDSPIANQELEAESFLRGITEQVKWQELISKWLAFEKNYQIKGVFLFFSLF